MDKQQILLIVSTVLAYVRQQETYMQQLETIMKAASAASSFVCELAQGPPLPVLAACAAPIPR